MEYTREEVLNTIVNVLKDVQEDFHEEAIEITEETTPIGSLAYFDSLASVVTTIHCLDVFDYEEELSIPTLFVNNDGKFLTVGEVADCFMTLINKKNKKI